MGCKKKSVLIGFAALCAALALLPFLFRPKKSLPKMPSTEAMRAVRLMNRVISVPCVATNQWTFPAASALSRRGTAPFVIVAKEHVTVVERKCAAACGARVTGVIPPYGIVAEVDAAALQRLKADGSFVAAEPLRTDDKMSDSLKRLVAAGGAGTVSVTMVPLAAEDAETVAASIKAAGGQPYEISVKGRGHVRADIPAQAVAALAARGDVRWAERHVRPKLLNDVAVQPALMNVTPLRDVQGLTGNGQVVTVSDTGLDTGNVDTMIADFAGRVAFIGTVKYGFMNRQRCYTYDIHGHGTHVAGSIAGSGVLSAGQFKGVAPDARLNVWQCLGKDGHLYFPEVLDDLFQPSATDAASFIHSASWGSSVDSEYDADCIKYDEWLWSNFTNLAIFAAGNDGTNAAPCIGSPGGAKNVLTVGATESLRSGMDRYAAYVDNPSQIAYFSSYGPMSDGRIKPDICAPGTFIISTRSARAPEENYDWGIYDDHYAYNGGTSMATPLVSGSAALVRQWLIERRGYASEMPTAALMKAVLMGGAHDMFRDSGTNCRGAAPNGRQGWGRVDLGESLYPTSAAVKLVDRIPFADGETFAVRITTTNAAPLAVQLVWTDHPGEYGAAQSLVNDLDLVVSNETTGAVWFGNGVEDGDRTNSVESVRIASAGAATYAVQVRSAYVPYGSTEGGAAALYVRGALDMADATNIPETVQLTVSVEDPSPGVMTPAPGVYRITKGVSVTLNAEDIICKDSYGMATWLRMVAGWTGRGDVPVSGDSGRAVVSLSQDSEITWRWNGFTNVLLCSYLFLPNYPTGGAFGYVDLWPQLGEVVEFAVPESTPVGSETYDISDQRQYYYEDGKRKRLRVQRLGRIETAATNSEQCEPVVDDNGHMATRFSITMDDSVNVLYYYFDEGSTNVATTLPTWWYQRYVAESPLSNQVLFTSVSPSRLEWTGGAGLTRVLERTPMLGAAADWRPVYTNAPAPVLTNVWEVPSAFSTNSFYRISW